MIHWNEAGLDYTDSQKDRWRRNVCHWELKKDDMPEGDAVAILRKAAKCTSVNTSVGDVLRYNVPGNGCSAWQTAEDACEALADMVERDYVSREAYEDLRDEFVWETTFLHRIAKKCGTKDVPSLKAYVEQLEAKVDELTAERSEIAELVGWHGEVDENGGEPLLVPMVAAMCEGSEVAADLRERVDELERENAKLSGDEFYLRCTLVDMDGEVVG